MKKDEIKNVRIKAPVIDGRSVFLSAKIFADAKTLAIWLMLPDNADALKKLQEITKRKTAVGIQNFIRRQK